MFTRGSGDGWSGDSVEVRVDVRLVDCRVVWSFVSGAESVVLGGGEGEFGVDGSSEVDGDNIDGSWESSARTTSAGVPPVDQCFKGRL